MIGGVIVGLLLSSAGGADLRPDADGTVTEQAVWFFDLFGSTVFIGALKMIVAPLIFFSILHGITSLPTSGELWSIGGKTLAYYFTTTSVAVVIGLVLVLTIQPGMRGDRDAIRAKKEQNLAEFGKKKDRIESVRDASAWETVKQNLERTIRNPFRALAEANSLAIIFFALLLGIALVAIGDKGRPVIPVLDGVNAAIMKVTSWIMVGAPFFIFCLVASLIAQEGSRIFALLGWYVITVIAGIALHVLFLLAVCKFVGKRSPIEFLKGIRRPWMIAFSTRSSAATLPVTMDAVDKELKVPRKIGDFVLPLGATINMDGTALYEGVAIIFLLQLFGGLPGAPADLTFVMTLVIFLTAVLASIGAAAVPDAGLITMVLVANAIGLDPEYIPVVFGVDAFLDMFRTSTNVMGDAVGCVVVSRLEGAEAGSG